MDITNALTTLKDGESFIMGNDPNSDENLALFPLDDPGDFLDSLREAGVRIMLNPEVINENHTKWKEVIRNGEQWKYVDSELN